MKSLALRATAVRFGEDSRWGDLGVERDLGALARFPAHLGATTAQRDQVCLRTRDLRWETLNEGIFVAGALKERADRTRLRTVAA